jgi:hypothetical protein
MFPLHFKVNCGASQAIREESRERVVIFENRFIPLPSDNLGSSIKQRDFSQFKLTDLGYNSPVKLRSVR